MNYLNNTRHGVPPIVRVKGGEKMKRYVVYYLYDDDTPRYLLARRGETPNDVIRQALEKFDGRHLDPKKVRFLLVAVGAD